MNAEKAARYQQYAEDAVHYAGPLNERDKLALLDLVRTWTEIPAVATIVTR
jgi:hypothetical protein